MVEPPSEDEVVEALSKLKGNEAGIMSCSGEIPLELYGRRESLMSTILQKEDLTHCDIWYEISLLDVMGKLFAKIIVKDVYLIFSVVLEVEEIVWTYLLVHGNSWRRLGSPSPRSVCCLWTSGKLMILFPIRHFAS